MHKYITVENAIKALNEYQRKILLRIPPKKRMFMFQRLIEIRELFQHIETENVKPALRSEWDLIDVEHAYGKVCYQCQECEGQIWVYRNEEYAFCPYCGARMK